MEHYDAIKNKYINLRNAYGDLVISPAEKTQLFSQSMTDSESKRYFR